MMSAGLASCGETAPPAASTSGSARTSRSSDAGTVAVLPDSEDSTISRPWMTASVSP
jgi:hypothetical protein